LQSAFEERLAAFARGEPVPAPGGDEQFGLRIMRRYFWRLFAAMLFFICFLVVLSVSAGYIRYGIVLARIDGEIPDPSMYRPVADAVREYLESQGKGALVPGRMFWHYLKDEESFRGGITLRIRGSNFLGRKEGQVVLALARPLFQPSGYWFAACADRRARVQTCALLFAVLHEVVHHSTGSHEEGIAQEDRLLAAPPGRIGEVDGLTPEDFRQARRVIDHYIRYR
jgi:hypothetical protein